MAKKTTTESVQIMVYSGNIGAIQFADGGNVDSVAVDICDNGSESAVIGEIIIGSSEKNKGKANSFSIQDYVENDEQPIKLVEGYYGDLKYTEASLQMKNVIYIYIEGGTDSQEISINLNIWQVLLSMACSMVFLMREKDFLATEAAVR